MIDKPQPGQNCWYSDRVKGLVPVRIDPTWKESPKNFSQLVRAIRWDGINQKIFYPHRSYLFASYAAALDHRKSELDRLCS